MWRASMRLSLFEGTAEVGAVGRASQARTGILYLQASDQENNNELRGVPGRALDRGSLHIRDAGHSQAQAKTAASKLMDLASILKMQNRDGGWPYRQGGGSWTESTVFALMAQSVEKTDAQSVERGFAWLQAAQRRDGGWPPRPSVAQSTWVTAFVALLPRDGIGRSHHGRAVDWLMGQTGQETSLAYRLRSELMGNEALTAEARTGWPFFPGAAAWVSPTSISILALEKARRYQNAGGIQARIETGRQFLLDRICRDGGWNYGRSNVLGVDAPSYPETTGQALLALNELQSSKLGKALIAAQEQARQCQSAEGLSWLQLGLQAHGVVPVGPLRPLVARHVVDSALGILAKAALNGRNIFLE